MKLNLDKGIYEDTKSSGKSVTSLIHNMEGGAGQVEPDYYLTRARKKRDNIALSDKDYQPDAFELQLMENEIKLSGAEVSLVEDFYRTTSATVLFPEFINRNVLLGMELGRNVCTLDDIVASTNYITSGSYISIRANLPDSEKGAYRVGEGGEFPRIVLTSNKHAIALEKFGHEIDMDDEVIRRMAVNQLAIHLQLLGARIRNQMVSWAIYVLVNGDGNTNSAPVTTVAGLNYDNLIDFEQAFGDFEPDAWIVTTAGMGAILKLSEFKDPLVGFNYQSTGKMISPLGKKLRKSPGVATDTLLGLAKNAAIEMIIEAGSQLTEYDKIINRQINQTVISQYANFAKLYTTASRVWNYAA